MIDVRGSGFVNGSRLDCRIGGSIASEAKFESSTLVRCSTQATALGASALSLACNGDSYGLGTLPFWTFQTPRVLTIVPSTAPRMTSTIVTVIGELFSDTASLACKFGMGVSADALWRSSSSIECVLPRLFAGNYTVHILMGDSEVESKANVMMVYNDANVRTVRPSVGPISASTPVQIIGAGFANSSYRCHFGKVSSIARWINSTSLSCSADQSPQTGIVKFHVSRAEGGIVDGKVSFFYTQPMMVHDLKPSSGPASGKSVITLTGTNFLSMPGLRCHFNSSKFSSTSFVSSTKLLCYTPGRKESSIESVTVHVSIDAVVTSETYAAFTYHPLPHIEHVTPNQIQYDSNVMITVVGQNFQKTNTLVCHFAHLSVGAEWENHRQVLCPPPKLGVGNYSLALSNNGIDRSEDHVVAVFDLRIDSVLPSVGRVGSGAVVTVNGKGFPQGMDVMCSFSGVVMPAVVKAQSQLVCEVPDMPAQEDGDLRVRVPRANVESTVIAFDLVDNLDSFEITPSIGSLQGGTIVYVRGLNNTEGVVSCKFGSTVVGAEVLSVSLLFCESPPAREGGLPSNGQVSFAVGDVNERYSRSQQRFEYHRPLSIFHASPSVLSNYGGDVVTLVGESFVEGHEYSVAFGGREILDAVWVSTSMLSVQSPSQETGTVSLEISVNRLDWFEMNATVSIVIPYMIHSIFPSASPVQAGAQVVTVLGQNFSSSAHFQCKCLGSTVDATILSEERLTCPLPHVNGSALAEVEVFSVNRPGLPQSFAFEFTHRYVIHSVFPSSGTSEGGTYVSIFGSSFFETDSSFCLFGEIQSPAEFMSSSLLECISPRHRPETIPLEIACNGADYTSDLRQFQFAEPFEVYRMIPTRGPQSGTELISIFGSNFYHSDNLQVLFGPSVIASGIYVTSTYVQAVLPARPAGEVQVEMSNNGADFTKLGIEFSYYAAIQIERMSPMSGSILGGTKVHVQTNIETDFTGWVCIFNYTTAEVKPLSNSSLSCVSPAGAPGNVRFTIVDRGRTIIDESRARFLYYEPCSVDRLGITIGMANSKTVVPVFGSNFDPNVVIKFGSVSADMNGFVSSSEVRVISPAHAPGVVIIECSLNGVDFSVGGPHFHVYTPARVSMLLPSRGPEMGGTTVRLHMDGAIERHDLLCLFGTHPVSATRINSGLVECDAPRAPHGNITLQVTAPGAQIMSEPVVFTIEPDIALIRAVPDSSAGDGGTQITVYGRNFREPCVCQFDLSHVVAEVVSEHSVVCIAPSHPPGIVSISVTAGDTRYTGIPFEYLQGAAIRQVSPVLGTIDGGTHLMIVGQNIDTTSKYTCVFGREDADLRDLSGLREDLSSALALTSTMVACSTPAHQAGTVLFRVIRDVDPQPKFDDLMYFSFVNVSVSYFHPSIGPSSGGTSVTLFGHNFRYSSDMRCKFGSTVVNVTWESLDEISCRSPASLVGNAPLSVSVNGLEYQFSEHGFRFIDWPEVQFLSPSKALSKTGALVDVFGRRFTEESFMTCRFGQQVVPLYRFLSSTRISCIAPEGLSGNVTVEVSANDADYTNFGVQFHYEEEEIVVASLPSGSGRRLLSMSADNFAEAASVKKCLFGTERVDAVEVEGRFVCFSDLDGFNSSSPTMRHLNNFEVLFDEFLAEFFNDTLIFHVSPLSAPQNVPSRVNILGAGFSTLVGLLCTFQSKTDSALDKVGTAVLVNASIVNESFAHCAIPPGLTVANQLTIYSGQSDSVEEELFVSLFSTYANPALLQLVPASGNSQKMTRVLVIGDGFRSSSTLACKFGQHLVNADFYSATLIVCEAPPNDAGVVAVDVSVNGVDFSGSSLPFTYKGPDTQNGFIATGRAGCRRIHGQLVAKGDSWVQLSPQASDNDNEYVGFTLIITGPSDEGIFATILTYSGATRTATANFSSFIGGCSQCKQYVLIEDEDCTDLLDIDIVPDLGVGFVSADAMPRRVVGMFNHPPRSAGWLEANVRSSGAIAPKVSNRLLFETAAEKFDPRNFRGILQTLDVWTDMRIVRIFCQVSDRMGRSQVQPAVISWMVTSAKFKQTAACNVDPATGITRDCQLEVAPNWLAELGQDSTASVWVEMAGGDILLGTIQIHIVPRGESLEPIPTIRGVIAYAEQIDVFNWAAIHGQSCQRCLPVKINVLVVQDMVVSDSTNSSLAEHLSCVSEDEQVAKAKITTGDKDEQKLGCLLVFDGDEKGGSGNLKIRVDVTAGPTSWPACVDGCVGVAEVHFRVWFPSRVWIEHAVTPQSFAAQATVQKMAPSPVILRPVEGWSSDCTSRDRRLPPLSFKVIIEFSCIDAVENRKIAIHAPSDVLVEEIGGSVFEISHGILTPRADLGVDVFESTQIAAKVASRAVQNVPLLIFVDTTQSDIIIDLNLYGVTKLNIDMLQRDALSVEDNPEIFITADTATQQEEYESATIIAYALLSSGGSFPVSARDGVRIKSLAKDLHVGQGHARDKIKDESTVVIPHLDEGKSVTGLLSATWSSCSSELFRTATVVRAKSFSQMSLKIAFQIVDNKSQSPTSYISDHQSLALGLANPSIATSCRISPVEIYDDNAGLVTTIDSRDASVTAATRGRGLEIQSTQHIKPSASSVAGDVTICVSVNFRSRVLESCRAITIVTLMSLRLRGLPWPVPSDISKEKDTILRIDASGLMQSLQFNVTAISSAFTYHDISHLCTPRQHCLEQDCYWYALEFNVSDASGESRITCGQLTLASRARLDLAKYAESDVQNNSTRVITVTAKLSQSRAEWFVRRPHMTSFAELASPLVDSEPYKVHVLPKLVQLARIDLSLPPVLKGAPGDSFKAAYKIVMSDECTSTVCYVNIKEKEYGLERIPCSYATSTTIFRREAVPCNYSITRDYVIEPDGGLEGLVRFRSSDADKLVVHASSGVVTLVRNFSQEVTLCASTAHLERCILIKTMLADDDQLDLAENVAMHDTVDKSMSLSYSDSDLEHSVMPQAYTVQEFVVAGEPCKIIVNHRAGSNALQNLDATLVLTDTSDVGIQHELSVQLSKDPVGSYVAEVVLTSSGVYEVHIVIDQQRVPGEPVLVSVASFDLTAGIRGSFPVMESDTLISRDDRLLAYYDRNSSSSLVHLFATIAGVHRLHVSLNSTEIPGSPFLVYVRAGEANSTLSTVVLPRRRAREDCSVGSECQVVVYVADSYGNRKSYSQVSPDVSGIASGPSTLTTVNKVQEGSQILTWLCTVAGDYELSIFVLGSEISQSPLLISVVPGTVSSLHSVIVSEDFLAPAGSPALAGIVLKDAFANLLTPAQHKEANIWLKSAEFGMLNETCRCSGHGSCTSSGTCSCQFGYDGKNCEICKRGFHGKTCQDFAWPCELCNNNGWCSPGARICECMPNWTGETCGQCAKGFFGSQCHTFCDDEITCQGRGKCSADGTCRGVQAPTQLVECSEAYGSDVCVALLLTQSGQYNIHIQAENRSMTSALSSDGGRTPFVFTVVPGPTSAGMSRVRVVSDPVVGQTQKLVLTASDKYGNSRTMGNDVVAGMAYGPSPSNLNVLDLGNGTYHLDFTPQLAGKYKLLTKIRGMSLDDNGASENDPQEIIIRPGKVWPSSCHVVGAVSRMVAGIALTFSIQARDRFGIDITSGGEPLSIEMHAQTEVAQVSRAIVQDQGNGLYKASLETRLPGQYRVFISAPHAPSTSAFVVHVLGNAPDCERSALALSGFQVVKGSMSELGIHTAIAGSQATVKFKLLDALGNEASISQQQLKQMIVLSQCVDCSHFNASQCLCLDARPHEHDLDPGLLPTKAGAYQLKVNMQGFGSHQHTSVTPGATPCHNGIRTFVFTVLSGAAIASRCNLEKPETESFAAGERLQSRLILRDRFDNLVSDPEQNITVLLHDKVSTDALDVHAPAPFRGVLECTMNLAQHVGTKSLLATVNDVVVGDLITIYVVPSSVSVTLSTIDSPHAAAGLVGMPVHLQVTLRDSFGNLVSSSTSATHSVWQLRDALVLEPIPLDASGFHSTSVTDSVSRYQVTETSTSGQFALTWVPTQAGQMAFHVLFCQEDCCQDQGCTALARCKVKGTCGDLACCTPLSTREGKAGPHTFKTSAMYYGTLSATSNIVGVDHRAQEHATLAGQPLPFEIHARDQLSMQATSGGDDFKVYAARVDPLQKGGREVAALHLADHANGIYSSKFAATRAGRYAVEILLGQAHVYDNPFKTIIVYAEEADASATKLESQHNGQAGAEFALLVHLRDKYGNGVEASAYAMKEVAVCVDGIVPVSTTKIDNGDQTVIKLLWTTRTAGEYVASVRLRGVHVNQSPHVVKIAPSSASPSSFIASGLGIRSGIAAVPSTFSLRVMDTFGNIADLDLVGGLDLELSLSSPRNPGQALSIQKTVGRQQDVLQVSWTTTLSGNFQLAVLMSGTHIALSPFELVVACGKVAKVKARLSPFKQLALEDGIPDMQSGQMLGVSVERWDVYDNFCHDNLQTSLVLITKTDSGDVTFPTVMPGSSVQHNFSLNRAGNFSLTVMVDSLHAMGSPAPFKVMAGPAVSAHLGGVSGRLLTSSVAEPCVIQIGFVDKYANPAGLSLKSLDVTIIAPDGNSVGLKLIEREDMYSLEWTPLLAGTHTVRIHETASEIAIAITSGNLDVLPETGMSRPVQAQPRRAVADLSYASGPALIWMRNAELAEFDIILRDSNEQLVHHPDADVEVSIVVDDCANCDIVPHVFAQENAHTVFFTPNVRSTVWKSADAITMQIHIKLGHEHISGSPYVSSLSPAITPLMVEARFEASLESLKIRFDAATDRGVAPSHPVDCSYYFSDTDGTALGSGCRALWLDARLLLLRFGQLARVRTGSVLALQNTRVRSVCRSSPPSFGMVAVQPPLLELPPLKVSLRAPRVVGACDDVTLHADILGVQQALTYEWTVSTVGKLDPYAVKEITAYLMSLPDTSSTIMLKEDILVTGTLNISVMITDRTGRQARASSIIVILALPTPSVYMDSLAEMYVTAGTDATIKAHVAMPRCAVPAVPLLFLWSLSNLKTGESTLFSEDMGPELVIPGNMLRPDEQYLVRLDVERPNMAVETRDAFQVRLMNTLVPRHIRITGGSRTVHADDPIVLSAELMPRGVGEAGVHDDDVVWACEPAPCFPGALEWMKASTSHSLQLPANFLGTGTYRISATVPQKLAGLRGDSDTIVLWVVPGQVSSTALFGPALQMHGGESQLSLRAQTASPFTWTCMSPRSVCSGMLRSVQDARALVLPLDLLMPELRLTYRLQLETAGPVWGLAQLKFVAPARPAGGHLMTEPTLGHAAETVFILTAHGWRDEPENLPLTFCLALGSQDASAPLGCSFDAARSSRLPMLPAADLEKRTHVHNLTLSVINSAACVTRHHTQVDLLPTGSPVDASRQLWKELVEAQESQDLNRVLVAIYALSGLTGSGLQGQGLRLLRQLELLPSRNVDNTVPPEHDRRSMIAAALGRIVRMDLDSELLKVSAGALVNFINLFVGADRVLPRFAVSALTQVISALLEANALSSKDQELHASLLSAAASLAQHVAATEPLHGRGVFSSKNLNFIACRLEDGAVDVRLPAVGGVGVAFPAETFLPSVAGTVRAYQVIVMQWNQALRSLASRTLSSDINTVRVLAEMSDGALERMGPALQPIHVTLGRVGPLAEHAIDRCYFQQEGSEEVSSRGTAVHSVTEDSITCETRHLTEFFTLAELPVGDWHLQMDTSIAQISTFTQDAGSRAFAFGLCAVLVAGWSLALLVGHWSDKRSMAALTEQVLVQEKTKAAHPTRTRVERTRDYMMLKALLRMRVTRSIRPLRVSLVEILKVEHLLMGIVWAPVCSPFNRTRRISCLAMVVVGNLTVSLVLLARGGATLSSDVSVGVLSAIMVFPAGMTIAAILRRVQSTRTKTVTQRRRVQRMQESVAVKAAEDLVSRLPAAGAKQQVLPRAPPPAPASGTPSFTRRSARRSPSASMTPHSHQAQPSPATAAGATSAAAREQARLPGATAPPRTSRQGQAQAPVKFPLATTLRTAATTTVAEAFTPLRMRAAMMPAALAPQPVAASRSRRISASLAPRIELPARPRVPRPGRPTRQPARPAASHPSVGDFLPRRLFSIRGSSAVAAPPPAPPPASPAQSLRDKSGRRRSRRERGGAGDRLLPIAEMDESAERPTSPAVPGAANTRPQLPSGRESSRRGLVSNRQESLVRARPSGPLRKGLGWELLLDPALAPLAYLAVVVWVALCLYLVVLHGLALANDSQRLAAWVVASSVALMHELLIQQVLALFLKLFVSRSSPTRRKLSAAGGGATLLRRPAREAAAVYESTAPFSAKTTPPPPPPPRQEKNLMRPRRPLPVVT